MIIKHQRTTSILYVQTSLPTRSSDGQKESCSTSTSDAESDSSHATHHEPAHHHPHPVSVEDTFDDEHALQCKQQVNQGGHKWFTFVELCEARASSNQEACTSPVQPTPVALLVCGTEIWRRCLLCLLSLGFIVGLLPCCWRMVPILPIVNSSKNQRTSVVTALYLGLDP